MKLLEMFTSGQLRLISSRLSFSAVNYITIDLALEKFITRSECGTPCGANHIRIRTIEEKGNAADIEIFVDGSFLYILG